MKRVLFGLLAVLLLGAALAAWRIWPSIRAARGGQPPVVDTTPPELPAELGRRGTLAILLFSKTSGFRHEEAIPACEKSVREIAARRGWQVFATENAAVFEDGMLARFRVVVGNNITGDNWSAEQKAAFVRWAEAGGGFVGLHGAAGTSFRYWDWYTDVLLGGARFLGHPMFPQFQQATLRFEDRTHPATKHFGETWTHTDEWYTFETSARAVGSRVLATLDESSYAPEAFGEDLRMGDHPIVWSACPGRGRSFYSALGHTAETYARPEHAQMLEGAIAFAAGLEGECR